MGDPKIKKDEQRSLMEILDDTAFELNGVLGSLKSQLLSETNYTEGEEVESSAVVTNIHKEIVMIERQLSYIKSTKEHCAVLLQQIEDEKRRKEMEETLKGVLIVGAINEFVRKRIAQEEAEYEHFMNFEYDYKVDEKQVVDDLFKRKEYKYVTKEDVEAIKQDKELNEMAAEDPYKYEKEALFHKDKYERMMERYMVQCSIKDFGDTFEEKEKNFINLLKRSNEYECSVKNMDDFFVKDREIVDKTLNPEELKVYDEICEEIRELAKTTRRRQQEFVTGKSSFKKGNGYTEKLIKREMDLCQKITTFKADLEKKSMELLADENLTDPNKLYVREHIVTPLSHITMFEGPIKTQYSRDALFLESRGMRIKEEKWDVYKNIPSKKNLVRQSTRVFSRSQSIALAKGERFEQNSVGRGSNIAAFASIAKSAADMINSIVASAKKDNGGVLTVSDKPVIKDCMARIILYQILTEEDRIHGRGGATPTRDAVFKNGYNVSASSDDFNEVAQEFAKTKAFANAVKGIRGKRFEDKVEKFLTTDIEKDIANKFVGKNITEGPKVDMNDSMERTSSLSK